MEAMNIIKMNKTIPLFLTCVLSACSLSPGMFLSTKNNFSDENSYVLIGENRSQTKVFVEELTLDLIKKNQRKKENYTIGIGDQISVTIWGMPDIFPIMPGTSDQNLRAVSGEGTIYFPYAGTIKANGRTSVELREILTERMAKFFNDPQIDVSVARYNSKKIYILGEVTAPQRINLTETPLSLSDALGEVKGLSTITAAGDQVFVVRQESNGEPKIFKADLSSPAGFIIAGNFYLEPQDIVYVNASGTARWNRVISQFFPFSTFLNSIDQLTSD